MRVTILKRKSLKMGALFTVIAGLAVVAVACPGGSKEGVFAADQLRPVEEAAVVRDILADNPDGIDITFNPTEGGPLQDQVRAQASAGEGTNHVIGSTYGTLNNLQADGLFSDVGNLIANLGSDRMFAQSLVNGGRFDGTHYYVPWLQAVYTMAAHKDAVQYLPSGADINDLTYDQFIQWGSNLEDATGSKQIGFPAGDGGLIHRFIHGYIYPAYTGSVVREFKSPAAVAMWEKFRELWDVVSPQSTTYSHMSEPLIAGEVMVAFDHTARLGPAFRGSTGSDFIIFPVPRGPEGRWILPVPVGLAIPNTTPDEGVSEAIINQLTDIISQEELFKASGWIPAVGGSTGDGDAVVQTILDGVNAQAAVSEDGVFPSGVDGGAFSGVYRDAFTQIVLEGASNVQEILDEQAAILNQIFENGSAPCWAPDQRVEGETCSVN